MRKHRDVRLSSSKRGYNADWRTVRRMHLAEHPLCVECQKFGRTVLAHHVDHITPHKGDRNLFVDRNNLQSLCAPCHSRKTAVEDGGFGRAPDKRPGASCGVDGVPVDGKHHWNR